MDHVDCVVIGAGVIGLAIARRLAAQRRDVLVLEQDNGIGLVTSSRNSEVIHAGLYYPTGSLMARLCIAGRQMLYRYCCEHGVSYRQCGKLIVATSREENDRLAMIAERAAANGVADLQALNRHEAIALEPALQCTAALLSPSTGIIDSAGYMLALRGDAEAAGASIVFHAPVQGVQMEDRGFILDVGGAEPTRLGCHILINAAGLQAVAVARRICSLSPQAVPQAYFAKGNYFSCAVRVPFSRLIYPVPVPGGLGVHLTLDLAGQARFGPDVEWIDQPDYSVDASRAARFYPAIRRYWPALPDGALQPGYAGIRPKIVPPEIAVQDFLIQGPHDHGVTGLVNLFGIESPGLTASLAIADHVMEKLERAA